MKVNLIPLAGKGKRFLDEGYTLPKPLIQVDGVPMVIAATKSMPVADKYIFICLQEHIDTYHIDRLIKKYYKNAVIVPIYKVTKGQASTCLLAESYIHPDAQLYIGACDNGMVYANTAYDILMNDSKTDAVIWTFRNNPNVLRNPHHWGWVKVDSTNAVKKVSIKVPISNTPIKDHAVVGSFSFKKAKFFFENAKQMIKEKRTIHGEFYNDECMNVLIENGYMVKPFEIKTYLGWGTPADLQTYEYWRRYFSQKK